MDVLEAITKRRTIRKFKQTKIDNAVLKQLVDAARLAPTGANQQPLKFAVINNDEKVSEICRHVKWAMLISPNGTPSKAEEPTAFIAVLADTDIKKQGHETETGAAVENILLAACSLGLGSCWMGAIDKEEIANTLSLEPQYKVLCVVALGYADEAPVAEPIGASANYYKDENGVLHVPKRSLDDALIKFL